MNDLESTVPVVPDRQYLKDTGRSSILNVALDVHGTTTGSYERGESPTQEHDVEFLRGRLACWEPSFPSSKLFDEDCRQVVQRAVDEYDAWHDVRSEVL